MVRPPVCDVLCVLLCTNVMNHDQLLEVCSTLFPPRIIIALTFFYSPVSLSHTEMFTKLTHLLSGGSYSIYYALAVASKELTKDHRLAFRCGIFVHPLRFAGPTLQTPSRPQTLVLSLSGQAEIRLSQWTLGDT